MALYTHIYQFYTTLLFFKGPVGGLFQISHEHVNEPWPTRYILSSHQTFHAASKYVCMKPEAAATMPFPSRQGALTET